MLIDSDRYVMTAIYSTINMQYYQQNNDLVLILNMCIYIYVINDRQLIATSQRDPTGIIRLGLVD